jgi:hypothetical protein
MSGAWADILDWAVLAVPQGADETYKQWKRRCQQIWQDNHSLIASSQINAKVDEG